MNSIFVGGLSYHVRVFGPHLGDKVRDSGLDEAFGVLEVSKHHFEMTTWQSFKSEYDYLKVMWYHGKATVGIWLRYYPTGLWKYLLSFYLNSQLCWRERERIKSPCLRAFRISRQRLFWHIAYILLQDTPWWTVFKNHNFKFQRFFCFWKKFESSKMRLKCVFRPMKCPK